MPPSTVVDHKDVVVRLRGVSKRFVLHHEKSLKERLVNFGRSRRHRDEFEALKGVDLDIFSGETIGLIGKNGSGKSTLLKVIGGIIQPTIGTVQRKGRLAALLELGAGFHPDLTGRDNVYLNAALLGLKRRQIDERFEAIVEFSGIGRFIDTQVKFYSSGMYVRLAFAVAVHVDPEILLVDEVLAVGDEPFQRKCMDKIRSFQAEGKTIILVSHSLEQVGELCNRVVVLSSGELQYDGEPAEGLRILREGFEADRHDDSHGPAGSSASIDAVRLLGDGAEVGGSVPLRADLQLEVTITATEHLADVVVGMGIETPLGQVVFGTNTERLGLPSFAFDPGTHVVQFELPDLRLGIGQYFVHASFGTVPGGELFRVPQAASFEVMDDEDRNAGVVAIEASARVA